MGIPGWYILPPRTQEASLCLIPSLNQEGNRALSVPHSQSKTGRNQGSLCLIPSTKPRRKEGSLCLIPRLNPTVKRVVGEALLAQQ